MENAEDIGEDFLAIKGRSDELADLIEDGKLFEFSFQRDDELIRRRPFGFLDGHHTTRSYRNNFIQWILPSDSKTNLNLMSNLYARYQGNVGYLFLLKLLNGWGGSR